MARLVVILAAPLLLASCLMTPGKFVSTLDIGKDRSFTFTYVGEAILTDPSDAAPADLSPLRDERPVEDETVATELAPKIETEETIAKRRTMAEALSKEQGYRSGRYMGDGKFEVDYAISGTLDRSFIYPFNSDASVIFPWIAIEVRNDGTARMKAPAFGEGSENGVLPAPATPIDDVAEAREGTFTLTTDAEIVMQNNEAGLTPGPGKKIVWRITPSSKAVPTAVMRFAD